jgi:hypothetical protein
MIKCYVTAVDYYLAEVCCDADCVVRVALAYVDSWVQPYRLCLTRDETNKKVHKKKEYDEYFIEFQAATLFLSDN